MVISGIQNRLVDIQFYSSPIWVSGDYYSLLFPGLSGKVTETGKNMRELQPPSPLLKHTHVRTHIHRGIFSSTQNLPSPYITSRAQGCSLPATNEVEVTAGSTGDTTVKWGSPEWYIPSSLPAKVHHGDWRVEGGGCALRYLPVVHHLLTSPGMQLPCKSRDDTILF